MKVTAAVFRDQDTVLLMRRASTQPLAGTWEYPGGKFEDREDGPACLQRELFEELGIKAKIGELLTVAKHTTESGKVIELYAYEIAGYTGDIQLRVHDQMHWVPLSELLLHPQLPADKIVSQKLAAIYKRARPDKFKTRPKTLFNKKMNLEFLRSTFGRGSK